MSTSAQIIANQKNAQASTGPRTPEGKAASSQNAIKHGATASRVVLAFEDPAEFERVHAEFCRQLRPATFLERFLIEDMVAAHWRMTRMQRVIRCHTDRAAYDHPSRDPMAAMADVMDSPEVARLHRYENTFRPRVRERLGKAEGTPAQARYGAKRSQIRSGAAAGRSKRTQAGPGNRRRGYGRARPDR